MSIPPSPSPHRPRVRWLLLLIAITIGAALAWRLAPRQFHECDPATTDDPLLFVLFPMGEPPLIPESSTDGAPVTVLDRPIGATWDELHANTVGVNLPPDDFASVAREDLTLLPAQPPSAADLERWTTAAYDGRVSATWTATPIDAARTRVDVRIVEHDYGRWAHYRSVTDGSAVTTVYRPVRYSVFDDVQLIVGAVVVIGVMVAGWWVVRVLWGREG